MTEIPSGEAFQDGPIEQPAGEAANLPARREDVPGGEVERARAGGDAVVIPPRGLPMAAQGELPLNIIARLPEVRDEDTDKVIAPEREGIVNLLDPNVTVEDIEREMRALHDRFVTLRAARLARLANEAGAPIPPYAASGLPDWAPPAEMIHSARAAIEAGGPVIEPRDDDVVGPAAAAAATPPKFAGYFGERQNGNDDAAEETPAAAPAVGQLATRHVPLKLAETTEVDLADPQLAELIHNTFAAYDNKTAWAVLKGQLMLEIQDLTKEELSRYFTELVEDLQTLELRTAEEEERMPYEITLLPLDPELIARMRRFIDSEQDQDRRQAVREILEGVMDRSILALTATADATTDVIEHTLYSLIQGHSDRGEPGSERLWEGSTGERKPYQPETFVSELPPAERQLQLTIAEEYGKLTDGERMSLSYEGAKELAAQRADERLRYREQLIAEEYDRLPDDVRGDQARALAVAIRRAEARLRRRDAVIDEERAKINEKLDSFSLEERPKVTDFQIRDLAIQRAEERLAAEAQAAAEQAAKTNAPAEGALRGGTVEIQIVDPRASGANQPTPPQGMSTVDPHPEVGPTGEAETDQ